MEYRPEIDGLRAFAVLPVILLHAGFYLFEGGFVGVDVFFVISGYLITTILINEMDRGGFSIVAFYERRARRILPALFLVMFFSIPFAWLWLTPSDMKLFSRSVAAVSLFVSNISLWLESGYFDTATELKPLLHTWSLAIEEQFYLLFPLFLFAMWRHGRRRLIGVLALTAVASLALAQWGSTARPSETFYLLPTRGWELLIGALVGFYLSGPPAWQPSRMSREILGVVGLAMLVVPVFAYDDQTPFPGFYALVPTLGAALIILFVTQQTVVGLIIGNRLCVGIGLISYSAYLWHQPLFAFAKHRMLFYPSDPVLGALAAASLALGYFSWKYVETPFRKKGAFSRRQVFATSAVVGAGLLSFGVVGYATDGNFLRTGLAARAEELKQKVRPNDGLSGVCDQYYTESAECRTSENPEIMVWGDSFAMHLVPGLLASKPDVKLIQATVSFCGPFFDVAPIRLPDYGTEWAFKCIETNDRVRSLLKRSPGIKYVVLGSPFVQLVGTQSALMNRDGSVINGRIAGQEALLRTLAELRRMGKVPVVFYPTPKENFDTGRCLVKSVYFGKDRARCDFSQDASDEIQSEVFGVLREVGKSYKVIDLSEGICENRRCSAAVGDVFIYRDRGHLSYEGSAYVGRKMDFYRRITGE